ncbi:MULTISPECIES: hypothetical protein [unclassified Streptomyces]|uniref:hypothetical protein n=1 Tax=unclassified Streptomyces TaxID=2593676 RepID=UPI0036635618
MNSASVIPLPVDTTPGIVLAALLATAVAVTAAAHLVPDRTRTVGPVALPGAFAGTREADS